MMVRLKEGLSPLLRDREAAEGAGVVEGGGRDATAPAATIGRRQGGTSLNVFDTFAARRRGHGGQGPLQSTGAVLAAAPRLGGQDQHQQDSILGAGGRQAPISLLDLGREQGEATEGRRGGLDQSISLVSDDEQIDQQDASGGSGGYGDDVQRYIPDAAERAEGFHGVEHVVRYGRVASAIVDRAARGLELKGFACRGASGRGGGNLPEQECGREALEGRHRHPLRAGSMASMPASAAATPATKKKCFKAFAMKK